MVRSLLIEGARAYRQRLTRRKLAAMRTIARTWAPGAGAAGSRDSVGAPTTARSMAAARSTPGSASPLRLWRRHGVGAPQSFLRDHAQVQQLAEPIGDRPDLADLAALDAEEDCAHPLG